MRAAEITGINTKPSPGSVVASTRPQKPAENEDDDEDDYDRYPTDAVSLSTEDQHSFLLRQLPQREM